jgi:hypothetical protein
MKDQPIDGNDLDMLQKYLTAAFGIDHYDERNIEHTRAKLVWQMAKRKGYGKKEFAERLGDFISSQKWATWTPADFFERGRVRLYPYSHYLAQSATERAMMAAYRVEGRREPLFGYIHEVEGKLERIDRGGKYVPAKVVQELPESREVMSEETREALRLAKMEVLKRERDELERELERTQQENAKLRHQLERAGEIIRELDRRGDLESEGLEVIQTQTTREE